MIKAVEELRIISPENNIFDTDAEYVIPLYQRAFTWEEKQLVQLIEDISDISGEITYYIGALIVSKQGDKYEVVDGQQRLTSLYLLLHCLGLDIKNTLTFACRDRSNYTLKKIKELLQENRSKLDMERIEPSIHRGLNILSEELSKGDYDKKELLKKLGNVVIYRIEVPENTDLNRYFEIMNTRGEQLEQHDILKATLMSYLPKGEDKAVFAQIWDACSDMTGYVQMHFVSKNNIVRTRLFGGEWNQMPPSEWNQLSEAFNIDLLDDTIHKITDIIDTNFESPVDDGFVGDDARVRFESVIEFPFFLLHTLKVLIDLKGIQHVDGITPITAKLLDDKKLVNSFDSVIKYGASPKGKMADHKEQFSKDFIICLLKTRFLFDKYIIKREYANDNSDGEWSIKSLDVSNNKPYYKNTMFTNKGEWYQERKNPKRVKDNLMIQSALRVSYTSPKVMHWITILLSWLSCEKNLDKMADYHTEIERIAQKATVEDFFSKCENACYNMGVNTPHIVFNYLDYLIWKSDTAKYADFVFEFRNSVEHWYPQNPSEGTFESWKDGVDQFGNLCIIQRNVNSKFSNMSPEAKKSTFRDMIAKGSIKLRIMSDMTEPKDENAASLFWKKKACQEHEEKMIDILRTACYSDELLVKIDE